MTASQALIGFMKVKILPQLDFLVKAPRSEWIRAAAVIAAIGLFGLMFNTRFGIFFDFFYKCTAC